MENAIELARAFLRAEEGADDYSSDDLINIARALAEAVLADAGLSVEGAEEGDA